MRVVRTEGRTNVYGLPEPPDDDGPDDGTDSPPENGEAPEGSEESRPESSGGSSSAHTPAEPIITIPTSIYRDGNGDDNKEGGAKAHPDCEVGKQHPLDLITSDEDLEALVGHVAGVDEVALDIETCPPEKALDPRNGSIRLISIATGDLNKAVDLHKVDPAPLLEVLKTKTLVLFNGKFDLSFLKNALGYEHKGEVVDVMLMHLINYFATGKRVEKKGRKYLEATHSGE